MLFVYKLSNSVNTDIYLGYTSKQLDKKLQNHIMSYRIYVSSLSSLSSDKVDKISLYDMFNVVDPSEWSIERLETFKTKGECVQYIQFLHNIQSECLLQDKEERVNKLENELNTRSLSSMMEDNDINDKRKHLDEQARSIELKLEELNACLRIQGKRETELNERERKLRDLQHDVAEREDERGLDELKAREDALKTREDALKTRENEIQVSLKTREDDLQDAFKERERDLKTRESEIQSALKTREAELKSREAELKSREAELKSQETDLKAREIKIKKQLEQIEVVQNEMDEREDRLDELEAKLKESSIPPITTKEEQIIYTKKKVSLTGQINRANRTLTTLKDDNPVKAELKQNISVWQKQLDLYVKELKAYVPT
jgi:chromosome segregation ATPase